jgi:formylglycine-generating enzyme required for sulfatase activity
VKWIEIPAGSCLVGDPVRRVSTGAYRIAELPVTNADYEPFLLEGYSRRQWWSDEGWAWRVEQQIEKPRFHRDPDWQQYLSPAQPIVGVSWFEASAFARFAGARLPTEIEWERAARGDEGNIFPWGNEWRPELAHHRGNERRTLPAGHFVQNVSPHGVRDCAGNVWQWCSDLFALGLRSARGGAWNAHPPQLRCANRNAWPPGARYSNLGFRLACDSPSNGAAFRT